MSGIDLDPTKIQFTTVYQVDKIPVYTIVGDGQGYTPNGTMAVGPVVGSPAVGSTVYNSSVANPYGRRCLPTFAWSIDGTNYYPMNIPIFYYNATYQLWLWQNLGFAGCSDSTVYFCATTQYDVGPQTMYLQFTMDSPT